MRRTQLIATSTALLLLTGAGAVTAVASDGGKGSAGKGDPCPAVVVHKGKHQDHPGCTDTTGHGKGSSWQMPFDAQALARVLHLSSDKAGTLWAEIYKNSSGPKHLIGENDPGFAAIAARAGVTPQQLSKALHELADGASSSRKAPCVIAAMEPVPGGRSGTVTTIGSGDAVVKVPGAWHAFFGPDDLVKALDLSASKAVAVYTYLVEDTSGPQGALDLKSSTFAQAARASGVTTQQLTDILFKLRVAAGGCGDNTPKPGNPGSKPEKQKDSDERKDAGKAKPADTTPVAG